MNVHRPAKVAQSPASPTADRCPQMASEKDARNMTFEAVQSMGWVITMSPKSGCVILVGNGHAANYTTWEEAVKETREPPLELKARTIGQLSL